MDLAVYVMRWPAAICDGVATVGSAPAAVGDLADENEDIAEVFNDVFKADVFSAPTHGGEYDTFPAGLVRPGECSVDWPTTELLHCGREACPLETADEAETVVVAVVTEVTAVVVLGAGHVDTTCIEEQPPEPAATNVPTAEVFLLDNLRTRC